MGFWGNLVKKAVTWLVVNTVNRLAQIASNEQVADSQPIPFPQPTLARSGEVNLFPVISTGDTGNSGSIKPHIGNLTKDDINWVPPTLLPLSDPTLLEASGYTGASCDFVVPFNHNDLINSSENEDAPVAEMNPLPQDYLAYLEYLRNHPGAALMSQPAPCEGSEFYLSASFEDCSPRPFLDREKQEEWDRWRVGTVVRESFDLSGNWADSEVSMQERIQNLLDEYHVQPADLITYLPPTEDVLEWVRNVRSVAGDMAWNESYNIFTAASARNVVDNRAGLMITGNTDLKPVGTAAWINYVIDTIAMAGMGLVAARQQQIVPTISINLNWSPGSTVPFVAQDELGRWMQAYFPVNAPSNLTPYEAGIVRAYAQMFLGGYIPSSPGNAITQYDGRALGFPNTNTFSPGGNRLLLPPGSYYNNSMRSGFASSSPLYSPPGASVGIPQLIELGSSNNNNTIGGSASYTQQITHTHDGYAQISVVAREGGDGGDDLPPMSLGIGSGDEDSEALSEDIVGEGGNSNNGRPFGDSDRTLQHEDNPVPRGMSQQQWDDFQRLARQFVSAIDDEIGNGRFNLRQGELEVQGSRVPGSTNLPRPSTHPRGISDIDILLRVDENTFNALVDDARQHNPNFPHQMNTDIANGRLGRFSLGSRWWNPRIHSAFWDEFAKPLDLPFDIQFSIVKEGSTFDNGPFMPIGGQ